MLEKSLLFLAVLTSFAFCQERWYPFRLEVDAGQSREVEMGTGVWWSYSEEVFRHDAYGPTIGIAALLNNTGIIPGVRLGAEANWKVVCSRVQYSLYKPSNQSVVPVINPQIGLTWASIINIYLGYNKALFNRSVPGLGNINVSFCMCLPSYLR